MPTAVAVERLVKRYQGHAVVDGVSLSVGAGEVLALLGPNGAGKTTTVECVAGLRRPDAGTVRVFGADPLRERRVVAGRIGIMLQDGGVHRAATARELVRHFAALHRAPCDPEALIRRLGIAAIADRRTRTLSIGERQRVSLAMALVGRPRVALLDEPTAGVDPAARRLVWELIAELRDDGVAILLTTHGMEEAERLADRVAVMEAGHVLALDTPAVLTAGAPRGLVLVTDADFDAGALAAALSAHVQPGEPGRWLVDVDETRIAEVAAWFAARDLPLAGIAAHRPSLEDVYLRLTGRPEAP